MVFATGCQWHSDNECELYYVAVDRPSESPSIGTFFMDKVREGLLGEKNSIYGYSVVRFGAVTSSVMYYYPLPLLVEEYIKGTITKPHGRKLLKICRTFSIKPEDLKI
jgi:hypothetical protein